MISLQDLVDTHLKKLGGLADTYKDSNPYKQEFVKHLLRDYLYDTNTSCNDVSLDDMCEWYSSAFTYRESLEFDISHLSLIKSVASQVFDNNSKKIKDYSDDPTETIDISRKYMYDFYKLYNKQIK